MKRKYVDILTKEELARLQKEIDELTEENKKLKEDNEHLSSLIHKDNKLMKVLLRTAHEFRASLVPEESAEVRRELADKFIAQLDAESGDRMETLRNYEHSGKVLPKLGIDRIDSIISYYDQKTFAEGIQYDVTIVPGFAKVISEKISTEDLSTLLADLLENACIATHPQERKNILLALTMPEDRAKIGVCDSGVPFPQEVRDAWGVRKLTTHTDDSDPDRGSGIGMMSTYQLCQKYAADFLIEDYPPDMLYTKCVSVTFPACFE